MTPSPNSTLAAEETLVSFCEVQERVYGKAAKAMESGDFETARSLLGSASAADTIQRFARISQLDGGNRGEQAMVLSLGTRWITDYLSAAQAAGLEPLRIHYAATQHEPLSQGAGSYTYHVDGDGHYWSVQGTHETKRKVIKVAAETTVPGMEDIIRTGILIDQETRLAVTPLVRGPELLAPGDYRLTLLLASADGDAAVNVDVKGGAPEPVTYRFAPTGAKFLRLVCSGKGAHHVTVKKLDFTLSKPDSATLTLNPVSRQPVCCGVVLERIE